ncbi:MAG: glycosyltransferase family 4 protein, partial [Cyanobacteria bacterium J06600_6]
NYPNDRYWSDWQQECKLADRILVNSNWSAQALEKTGIKPAKIITVPLAYQREQNNSEFTRIYPDQFTKQRPLKVLFLGQIIIRKGIAEILDAITLLTDFPIEFWFVGQIKVNLPRFAINHPQIKWLGEVSRSLTYYYYQQADVFLLPTHSDGFGLTQLEAQAWKLPLITSQFCGSVVKDQINGLILPQITAKAIVNSITFCLENPHKLAELSHGSTEIVSQFTLEQLSQKIADINIY